MTLGLGSGGRGRHVEAGVHAGGVEARLAAAPISWGVCEVPGWGLQLAPDRVLAEMAQLGLAATELGPQGWLPLDGASARRELDRYGLRLVGGFVPLVVHEADLGATRDAAVRAAAQLAAAGADVFVAALVADLEWSASAPLDDERWRRARAHLRGVADLVGAEGPPLRGSTDLAGARGAGLGLRRTSGRSPRRRRTWSARSPTPTSSG